MPIPIIVPAIAGIAGATSLEIIRRYVKAEEEKAIQEAKLEAEVIIKNTVQKTLSILKNYERNIQFEILGLIVSVLLMLVFLNQYDFLAKWVAVFVSLRTMDRIAYSYAMWCIKPEIKHYLQLFWNNWVKCKPKFQPSALKLALNESIRNELRSRINTEEALEQIKLRVDSRIHELNLMDKATYMVFGSSRITLAKKIHIEVLKEVDYGQISNGIARVISRIIGALIVYVPIVFLIRIVISNLSGLTLWILFIASVAFFVFWSFIHWRCIKDHENSLS